MNMKLATPATRNLIGDENSIMPPAPDAAFIALLAESRFRADRIAA
jgi:hypothetical protein